VPPTHDLVPGDAREKWSVCAQFISTDVEWFGACRIVSAWKNFSRVHAGCGHCIMRKQRVLRGVA
jgi:hypothetical protein